MRILVLWAQTTQPNMGVRVLAEGTAAWARWAFGPETDVRFQGTGGPTEPGNDGPVNVGHVRSLARMRLRDPEPLREWLTGFDLIIDTRAGDSFTDIYGVKRLAKMSPITLLATRLGVPVILGPQTIGPFGSTGARALARLSLSTARAVFARDPLSAQVGARLGRPDTILATDVVFALEQKETAKTRDVLLNVSGLLWSENTHVDATAYQSVVRGAIESLRAGGRKVSLLAHVVGKDDAPGDNDRYALNQLQADFDAGDLIVPPDLDSVREAVASANLVIGSRMHACLNALSVGTPSVAMAYSRKFDPLLRHLGWDHTVDLRSTAALRETLAIASKDQASLQKEAVQVGERAREILRTAAKELAQSA